MYNAKKHIVYACIYIIYRINTSMHCCQCVVTVYVLHHIVPVLTWCAWQNSIPFNTCHMYLRTNWASIPVGNFSRSSRTVWSTNSKTRNSRFFRLNTSIRLTRFSCLSCYKTHNIYQYRTLSSTTNIVLKVSDNALCIHTHFYQSTSLLECFLLIKFNALLLLSS